MEIERIREGEERELSIESTSSSRLLKGIKQEMPVAIFKINHQRTMDQVPISINSNRTDRSRITTRSVTSWAKEAWARSGRQSVSRQVKRLL